MSDHRGAEYQAEADAREASKALFDALHDQFFALAARHRIAIEDARLFLMNGETPRGR